ncbi:hypothetical protein EJ04DRAFT_589486 [Polyplosphaeria fusca]|uniref:DUF7918 domain-containing protein n=1 Tax=Polyplosphaeria fusca TaxID=682080 RepID=A0A9P4QMF7_9PLEO|nr:hypothetical protein EJ04DRAFT_589486 [Polyplosphaeria fusca]
MPTYRSISVSLHSQFDVGKLPEYLPKPNSFYAERGIEGSIPEIIDEKTSTFSVYIPVLPGSQFWISYSIAPPVPDEQQFLFKLFINNAHIVSWCCGKKEGWKGRSMFALFEREEDENGKKRVEKRALFFAAPDREDGEWKGVTDPFDPNAHVEIRVYRASARKRVDREIEVYAKTAHGSNGRGIDLVNAGRAGAEHPKRFYKFALIDPVDQPFATFRYYYRTWGQLEELCLFQEGTDEPAMSIIEPSSFEPGPADPEKMAIETKQSDSDDVFKESGEGKGGNIKRSYYVPRGAPDSRNGRPQSSFHEPVCVSRDLQPRSQSQGEVRHSGLGTPPRFYGLSALPPVKFELPAPPTRSLPSIPPKHDVSSTEYRPHPAYPVEDWAMKTPSPVKSMRDGISTPPLGARRGFGGLSIMNAVSNAWRRRGLPNSGTASDTCSHTTPSGSASQEDDIHGIGRAL